MNDPRRQVIAGTPPRVWGKPCHPAIPLRKNSDTISPHVCGENSLSHVGQPKEPSRYTPTCVGKTASYLKRVNIPYRYTPTCVGKTVLYPCFRNSNTGTPPRVWGKRRPGCSSDSRGSVHPHVCGENASTKYKLAARRYTPTCVGKTIRIDIHIKQMVTGTPPRVWGKQLTSWHEVRSAIPVYPHVCGENSTER